MTVTLRPEDEKLIAEAIRSGAYRDPQEVIARALEVLREGDEWLSTHRDEISAKIDRAFEQFERGEVFSADQSREEMKRRKELWLSKRKA